MPTCHLVTLFPEFFNSPLEAGLMARAIGSGIISFTFHNPRDFAKDKHHHVDDRPFGGGAGMVMLLEPVEKAVASIPTPGEILLMSPGGKRFDQHMARKLAGIENLTLICGRYEGVDDRLESLLPLTPVSVCDAVLNGGETAALLIIEAVARLLPGFMGAEESASEESFGDNLLEYPHYTRPQVYAGKETPQVLLSGNHAQIARWRRERSLLRTLRNRPDLLARANLSKQDAEFLRTVPRSRTGRNISFCLLHYPVFLEDCKTGASSLTNLDIHDIGRISRSYGMGPFFVLTPLKDQLEILRRILEHWRKRGDKSRQDRKNALNSIVPVANFGELEKASSAWYGREPVYVATSASWPDNSPISLEEVRELSDSRPIVICLGTARGLDMQKLPFKIPRLRPLRFLDENHLSVRSAAAILADRLLGDYN